MADKITANFDLASANHAFSAIWKLSRNMKAAGWTYKSSSDGSTKDTTGTATNDKWGGAVDPSSDSYPAGLTSVAAWWNASGPVTLKLPIIAAPSGTLVRGEKVTQATSAAEGELVGFDFDGVSAGHVVILPRVGTFDNTHVVTGSVSAATFTPNGTINTFIPEIVIFKNSANTTSGSIYMQRVSNEVENASRFSVLAGSAGCTATIAPAAGGTGNAFPSAGSYVACGSQLSGSITHSNWFTITSTFGKAQIVAVNNTPATGVSADGTFWILIGGDTSIATNSQFLGYFRCDNSEDGDLDPFVFFKSGSVALNNANARIDNTGGSQFGANVIFQASNSITNAKMWLGWRRRGFSSGDAFNAFTATILGFAGGATNPLTDNNGVPETIGSSYTSKRLREPIFMISQNNTNKGRKGSPRWLSAVQGGATFDTYDAKQKVMICQVNSSQPGVVAGPFDGSTTPLQA